MVNPSEGLTRLRAAVSSGQLDDFCTRHGVRVLTVFGSAGRGEECARDLDIGVLTEVGVPFDLLAAGSDLSELSGVEAVDVVHLNKAGPVLRERALVNSVALYESEPGALATAQAAAIGERIDTDPSRRLDLELLAE